MENFFINNTTCSKCQSFCRMFSRNWKNNPDISLV